MAKVQLKILEKYLYNSRRKVGMFKYIRTKRRNLFTKNVMVISSFDSRMARLQYRFYNIYDIKSKVYHDDTLYDRKLNIQDVSVNGRILNKRKLLISRHVRKNKPLSYFSNLRKYRKLSNNKYKIKIYDAKIKERITL